MPDALSAISAASASPPPASAETEAQTLIAAHSRFGAVDATGLAQAVTGSGGDKAALAHAVSSQLPQSEKGAFVQAITVTAHKAASTPAQGGSVDHSLWGQVKDAGGVLWGAAKDMGHLAAGVGETGYDLGLGPVVDAARAGAGLVTGHTPDAPSWAPSTSRGVASVESAAKTAWTAATHPAAVWNGLKAPYEQDIAQGRWGALIAQTAVDFGGLADGESEAVDLARGASVAEKLGEGANAVEHGASAVGHAGEADRAASSTGHALQAATDDARKTETAGAPAGIAEAVTRVTSKVGGNEVTWTVNAQGRGVQADAVLRQSFDGAKRGADETKLTQEIGKSGGRLDDDGGHMIAHRFMLDQGEKNMFPQNANFNRGAYKTVENEWAAWTKAGGEVHTHVELKTSDGTRPDQVRISYSVKDPATGKTVYDNRVRFTNEAGETFTRKSGAEISKLMKGQ